MAQRPGVLGLLQAGPTIAGQFQQARNVQKQEEELRRQEENTLVAGFVKSIIESDLTPTEKKGELLKFQQNMAPENRMVEFSLALPWERWESVEKDGGQKQQTALKNYLTALEALPTAGRVEPKAIQGMLAAGFKLGDLNTVQQTLYGKGFYETREQQEVVRQRTAQAEVAEAQAQRFGANSTDELLAHYTATGNTRMAARVLAYKKKEKGEDGRKPLTEKNWMDIARQEIDKTLNISRLFPIKREAQAVKKQANAILSDIVNSETGMNPFEASDIALEMGHALAVPGKPSPFEAQAGEAPPTETRQKPNKFLQFLGLSAEEEAEADELESLFEEAIQ